MLLPFFALFAFGAAVVNAAGVGCPVFDADMNLFVLGGASDYVLGAQDSWSSATAQTLSVSGTRPPFDGASAPRCYLAQFFNAIYILGADSSNPNDVYILDVASKSWSQQKVDGAGIDPTDQVEILDHDTNVFYALSKGGFWFLHMNDQVKAESSVSTWNDMGSHPAFNTDNYKPTLGLANNHIHMFGATGASPGQAYIFFIHFASPVPAPQLYPSLGGKPNFPVAHGQAPSLFREGGPVQTYVAFIPDDGSATYLVDTVANTTLVAAGPSDKSAGSIFTASTSAVVQLTASGQLFFLPVDQSSIASASSAAWKTLATLPGGSSTGSGAGSSTHTSSKSGSSPTSGASGASASGTTASGGSDAAGAAPRLSAQSAFATLVLALLAFF